MQGNAKAQYGLGKCYFRGEGLQRNYSAAVVWFRRAAEQGLADAQNDLGVMYADGKGVPKDLTLAYSLAMPHGNPKSIEFRKALAADMKPAQIADAERLVRDWRQK